MNIISGKDPLDSTSAPVAVPDFTKNLGQDIKGLKIGIPKEYFIEGMDKEIEKSVRDAVKNSNHWAPYPLRFLCRILNTLLPHIMSLQLQRPRPTLHAMTGLNTVSGQRVKSTRLATETFLICT